MLKSRVLLRLAKKVKLIVLTFVVFYFAYQRKQLDEMLTGFQRNPFVEAEIESERLNSFAMSFYRESQQSSFVESK